MQGNNTKSIFTDLDGRVISDIKGSILTASFENNRMFINVGGEDAEDRTVKLHALLMCALAHAKIGVQTTQSYEGQTIIEFTPLRTFAEFEKGIPSVPVPLERMTPVIENIIQRVEHYARHLDFDTAVYQVERNLMMEQWRNPLKPPTRHPQPPAPPSIPDTDLRIAIGCELTEMKETDGQVKGLLDGIMSAVRKENTEALIQQALSANGSKKSASPAAENPAIILTNETLAHIIENGLSKTRLEGEQLTGVIENIMKRADALRSKNLTRVRKVG